METLLTMCIHGTEYIWRSKDNPDIISQFHTALQTDMRFVFNGDVYYIDEVKMYNFPLSYTVMIDANLVDAYN